MRTKTRIYIAGPMRGHANYNYPAFNAAAKRLRRLQYEVVNPAEVSEGFGNPEQLAADPALLERVMRREISKLAECDAIYLLPGWERSHGARRELAAALTVGLEVVHDRRAR